MTNYISAVFIGTALTAAASGFGAATAHASIDYAHQPARQVVTTLQTMGYSVQINGATNNMPLSACRVTGVDGLTTIPSGSVFVDVSCANGNNS